MAENALEIKNLTKVFDGKEVLRECNLTVQSGTIYGLLGANGAGKTTTFKLITGLLTPTWLGGLFLSNNEWRCSTVSILKLELKKTNIKPYCWIAVAIFICVMGLTYIFAWVPHLASGDKNAIELFSSYEGIFSISGAIALMAFSILAASMGF